MSCVCLCEEVFPVYVLLGFLLILFFPLPVLLPPPQEILSYLISFDRHKEWISTDTPNL